MGLKYFGTDGVRGIYGKTLTLELVEKVANALVSVGSKKIVIGHDTRESCQEIKSVIKNVLYENNVQVIDVGVIPTSTTGYFVLDYACDFGIMITASHNPPEHNGIKIFNRMGQKINGEELERIDAFTAQDYKKTVAPIDKWADFLVSRFMGDFKSKKLPKIAIDFANGSGAYAAMRVLKRLGFSFDAYATESYGKNVNVGCGSLHPEFLQKQMKKNKADLGFTFDGDADRCITLNEKGEIIDGEVLLAALALHFKVKEMVSTVVFNGGAEKFLVNKGIKFTRTPVGCRHVITALKSLKVPAIGGEPNGHFMFPSVTEKKGILIDDGLVTALMITSMVVNSGKTLSKLCEGIPMWHYFNGEVRGREVPLSKDEADAMKTGGIWVDGCRVLVRKSGTEDMTRIYVEGEDKQTVDKLAKKYME